MTLTRGQKKEANEPTTPVVLSARPRVTHPVNQVLFRLKILSLQLQPRRILPDPLPEGTMNSSALTLKKKKILRTSLEAAAKLRSDPVA